MFEIRLSKWLTVKEAKEYPWPCEPQPDRMFELMPGDVLTKSKDGTYAKHNGLGMFGFVIPDADIVEMNEPIRLVG